MNWSNGIDLLTLFSLTENTALPYDHRHHLHSNGTLIISSAQKRPDEGSYFCTVDISHDGLSSQESRDTLKNSAIITLRVIGVYYIKLLFIFPLLASLVGMSISHLILFTQIHPVWDHMSSRLICKLAWKPEPCVQWCRVIQHFDLRGHRTDGV